MGSGGFEAWEAGACAVGGRVPSADTYVHVIFSAAVAGGGPTAACWGAAVCAGGSLRWATGYAGLLAFG